MANSLVGKNLEEMREIVAQLGGSNFRATQIYNGIYLKSCKSFDEMTDLPKAFREQLNEQYVLSDVILKDKQVSSDGTMKFLFELSDGNLTEAVLMRFDNRANLTACISSQVGCPMGCAFCATAKLGFKRSLKTDEILKQIYLIQADTGLKVTNIVFMGQGEPLLNLDNVLPAIDRLREDFKIGSRRITVSTCGIIPGIRKLAEIKFQPTVAISLHSPNHEVRKSVMPVETKYPIKDVIDELRKLTVVTGRRVTIEYILIKGLNDSPKEAKELCELISKLKCNVNLILYNENEYCSYKKPDRNAVLKFKCIVEASGKKVTVRLERGADIDAACGQLSSKYSENSKK
ncbi:MAG: 23S rRNA (adenine(2503)-C(2))-methyltransferase RlmN [Candidatus Gastranaerophilales bacterium]|nr:23S rRNA (adenine(2503)-C(2))-methyltransferase RlmN [Candidatus Gastranaerophilales bacterium]